MPLVEQCISARRQGTDLHMAVRVWIAASELGLSAFTGCLYEDQPGPSPGPVRGLRRLSGADSRRQADAGTQAAANVSEVQASYYRVAVSYLLT